MRAAVLRALCRQQGTARRMGRVTELLALNAAPGAPCIAAGGREAGAGSRAARDLPLAGRFAQPTISWWGRSGHSVIRAAQSAAHTEAVGTRLMWAAKLRTVLRRPLAGAVSTPH